MPLDRFFSHRVFRLAWFYHEKGFYPTIRSYTTSTSSPPPPFGHVISTAPTLLGISLCLGGAAAAASNAAAASHSVYPPHITTTTCMTCKNIDDHVSNSEDVDRALDLAKKLRDFYEIVVE